MRNSVTEQFTDPGTQALTLWMFIKFGHSHNNTHTNNNHGKIKWMYIYN
jgi:hypothetical protein